MSSPTRWVISPTDGRTHVLLPVADHPSEMLQARCSRLLPRGAAQHECLPGRPLCVTCLWCYLAPAPVFARHIPAGRRVRNAAEATPGGQPVPVSVLPRWARCPVDQHLHLLAAAQAQAAEIQRHGRAGCGRLIPVVGLTIDGAAAGSCESCMAVGTAQ